jgi:hypothetical protein
MKLGLFLALVCCLYGCGKPAPHASGAVPTVAQVIPKEAPPAPEAQHKPAPIFWNRTKPTVRYDSYVSAPHQFDCPDNEGTCKQCPVGEPDRVIRFAHGEYRDVPESVNVYFACTEINMLVPESGPGVWSDEFICQREPQDGFVQLNGHRYACAEVPRGTTFSLGTLQPGESKSVPVQ